MWRYLRIWTERRSPAQVITGYYLLAVTVSILLFSIPAVLKPGVQVSFFDTVFMAVSVVSDTGLTVFNIAETYSVFGYVVIMVVLQFAGIGIMAMSTFFWLLLGRRIGLRERQLIMADNNQFALSGLVHLVKDILRIILLTELIGALLFGFRFLHYYPTWKEAFLHGLFASVSATTNAGMDITGQSLAPYAGDYFVQTITIFLIIFGAIGFPVLIEVKTYVARKALLNNKHPFRFSLFTKLATFTYGILLMIGTVLIWLLERNHSLQEMSWHRSFFYALFQTTTTRSAGLTTMDINQFTLPTLLLMCVYMFIGGSPNSVGGGIRTTTFALNMLFLFHYARGNREVKVFRRELHQDDILKSLAITLLAFFMCSLSVIAISISDKEPSLMAIVLDVCSSFGTVGLSMGITPDLSIFAKCILMVLMFVGRIGLTSSLNLIGNDKNDRKYHYPVERVMTG
ncbi:TrkH family potassium uptake protein [Paenibacillus sp. MMS18-CY102]|uniref:TrkH family potassium uptake protein n=1 Tax=Paenibacillus sp. MMS18-CY102 TaxID=2682849 RepID=UPI001365AA9D|nr:TrkH family potassium uptake protein [Paenibacillus sp. MMS18-CY102]MWC29748.1 TrkH family potassium uptake protein [Paenibacillus sp. MMS18-CY102]